MLLIIRYSPERWVRVMDDELILLKTQITKDSCGVEKETFLSRTVMCRNKSVTRSEFFGGGRSGLNPEMVFYVFAGDYEGETLCRFHGQTYTIYRTFLTEGSDYIELYVERKGGSNGKA